MIRLGMKNCSTILIEKRVKYQLYHLIESISVSISLVKIYQPSNQQQIIEQTKFTYSPLGKAFEKQIKTIEDQGQKQIDALEKLKDQNKQLVNVNDDDEDKLLHSKERKLFENIYKKRLDKTEELTKKIYGNSLIFTILSTGETVDFSQKMIL